MLMAGIDEIGMDFVGEDQNVVAQANFAHAAKLLFRIDAAGRVVRVAQEHKMRVRVCAAALEIFKVHFVMAVFENQCVIADDAAVIYDGVCKRIIDRALQDDLFAWLREGLNEIVHGWDNARGEDDGLRLDLPAVTAREPLTGDGFEARRQIGIK